MQGRRFPSAEWPRLVAPRRVELAPPDHYVRALPLESGFRVIDLGAGPGFFEPALLEAIGPGGSIVAVDVEPIMIEALLSRLGTTTRIETCVAPLATLPYSDGSFDAGLLAFVAHELDDLDAALKEARRVITRPGPLIVLEWYPIASAHGPPIDERIGSDVVAAALERADFRVEAPRAVTDCQYMVVGR